MDLLRDIWDSIDPQSNIDYQSETLIIAVKKRPVINII
jgi:hypothetical protein